MVTELTAKDIEQHSDDCIMYCEEDLIAATQVEATQIERRMQLRFAKTFGGVE